MEVSSDGSSTPPASVRNAKAVAGGAAVSPRKRRAQDPASSVIDPALSAMETDESAAAAVAAASLKSPASNLGGGEMTERDAEKERAWVDNMRLIEWMREYVKKRLEEGDFDEDRGTASEEQGQGKDVDMADGGAGVKQEHAKEDLYPSLKVVGN